MRADGCRARAGASASPGSGGEWQAREDRRCPRALRGARGAGADEFEIGRAVVPTGPEHGHRGVDAASRYGRAGHRRRSPQHQPELVHGGPRSRPPDYQAPEREARGGVRRESRALRGLRDGGAAVPRPRRRAARGGRDEVRAARRRSEEHTSELQSLAYLVCRLLLEKKNKLPSVPTTITPP